MADDASSPPYLQRRQFSGLAAAAVLAPALAGCALPQAPAPSPTFSESLDLYLLAGQSNMAGRGRVEAVDREPPTGLLSLNADADADVQWQPARDPLHADKPSVAGVGPGRSFGLAMAAQMFERRSEQLSAQPGRRIGLVPCAVGGSSISTWQPGARFEIEPGRWVQPFDDTLRRMRLASTAGRWRGVLWHQGESDSNERDAPHHERRLRDLIERLRAAAGDAQLPVLIGQMGRWPAKPWSAAKAEVDAVHQRVAQTLGHAAFVSAEGLGLHADGLNVHFDAAGARELGRRYASAMLRLQAA